MLNGATGGTLDQHLPDTIGHDGHMHTPGAFADHAVRLEPGSLAARAGGADPGGGKSPHPHGGVALGEGLAVSGRAAEDDAVEAIELADRRFALGVLWHPEEDERDNVVAALVAEARRA
jgi:putative glutamine amidotransferase